MASTIVIQALFIAAKLSAKPVYKSISGYCPTVFVTPIWDRTKQGSQSRSTNVPSPQVGLLNKPLKSPEQESQLAEIQSCPRRVGLS